MSYHARIAVNHQGNPVLQVRPTAPEFLPHPTMPYPIALPAHDFPTAHSAEDYATALLSTAGVITRAQQHRGLVWISAGYTLSPDGSRQAVRRAPIPAPGTVSVYNDGTGRKV